MYKKFRGYEPYCLVCFEEIKELFLVEGFLFDSKLCLECQSQLRPKWKKIDRQGLKIHSIYAYKGFAKELYIRYKESGDRWLAPIFLRPVSMKFRLFCLRNEVILAPVSSFRKFNHNEELVKVLGIDPVDDLFNKKLGYQQANRNAQERREIFDAIELGNIEKIRDKKVVIFDDVCTTGYTLRACARLIQRDVLSLKVFSLFYHDV